jgi:hypothetical protein
LITGKAENIPDPAIKVITLKFAFMKTNILSVLICVFLSCYAIACHAQKSITFNNIEKGILSDSKKGESIRHVNLNTLRDFMKRFPSVTDVKWRKVETDYVATFIVESNQTMVRYQGNGKWAYTINRYDYEKKLPEEVRVLVKKTYYDYTIRHIDEIYLAEQPNTIYLVLIEDDKTFKTIRVCEGEMEEIHELIKVF